MHKLGLKLNSSVSKTVSSAFLEENMFIHMIRNQLFLGYGCSVTLDAIYKCGSNLCHLTLSCALPKLLWTLSAVKQVRKNK